MKVPFLDLASLHKPIRSDIDRAIDEVINTNAFAGGKFVTAFEDNFAAYCETKHAVGVGSGTDALWLALLANGVGPGDEVVTVANTFIATVEAISFAGAKPVLVDVEEQTYNMIPDRLREAITPQTKAIIPVHLFGQMASMEAICAIAKEKVIPVIEDASQAHGARFRGYAPGAYGSAACFSFYPGKNLGAFGEAGAVVTNDDEIAAKIKMLRDHGQSSKYHHDVVGWNGRMDGIQGAILDIKLAKLDEWNESRRAVAVRYSEILSATERVTTPYESQDAVHVYHLYPVQVPSRDDVGEELTKAGIGWGIHYPVPIHLTRAYKALEYRIGDFPISERLASAMISLPMFPGLTDQQIEYVCDTVIQAVR